MAHVRGIGGIFLYSPDPQTLAQWYADHLGIELVAYEEGANYAHEFAWDPDAESWDPRRNTTWAVLKATDEQAAGPRPFTVNYQIDDLRGLLDSLRAAGVDVEKVDEYEYGLFAYVTDPEGNTLELYEPATPPGFPDASVSDS